MNSFKSIYDQKNRFYIDWDFHYNCNYSCSYCFQKWENKLNTKKADLKNIKVVLKFLEKIKYNFTLGLLGGEPTLYEKEYFYILDYLFEIFQDKINSDCYISTNGSKPLSFYKKHKYYPKTYQWISIHLEYFKENDLKKYLYLKEKTDKIIISPIIIPNFDKLDKILAKLYDFAISNDFEYFPQFLYKNNNFEQFIFPSDKLNNLYNQSKKEFIINNEKKFTLNEILYKNFSFKNYICYANYLNIDPFNNLKFPCLDILFNLNKNFNKSLKLKPKKIVCPFDTCKDFPKMLSEKIKGN